MERSNDLFQRMRSESHKLNDAEIAALARYYGAPPAN
jgi:cytochrome c553